MCFLHSPEMEKLGKVESEGIHRLSIKEDENLCQDNSLDGKFNNPVLYPLNTKDTSLAMVTITKGLTHFKTCFPGEDISLEASRTQLALSKMCIVPPSSPSRKRHFFCLSV